MPVAGRLLAAVDVIVAGRYLAGERVAEGMRGSANKTIHRLTERHTLAEIEAVPEAEAILLPDGGVVLSGIGPLEKQPREGSHGGVFSASPG